MRFFLMLAVTLFSLQSFSSLTNCDDAESFPQISKSELQTEIEKKSAYVVDVNGTKSYAKRHIDSAVNFETIKLDLSKNLPVDKSKLVVAYCGGPSCGAWKKAAVAACKMGYTNIKHFKEGIKGW